MPLTYRLHAYTILQECTSTGVAITGRVPVSAPSGANFTISGQQSTGDKQYIIEFWDWDDYPTQSPDNLHRDAAGTYTLAGGHTLTADELYKIKESKYYAFNYDPENNRSRYFLISAEQLATRAEALVTRFSPTAGAVVMPFKFRPQTSDFTKDITFSGMGGISWNVHQQRHHMVSGLVGLGITSVTLTPKNSTVLENRDQAAVTLSVAVLYQWERLQLGLLLGADYLGAGDAGWIYNKKHWLAAGIGFNIFKPEADDAKDTGNK